jgi:hypothetical protein
MYLVLRRRGMRLEIVERDELERGRMRSLEYGRRRGAGLERLLPACGDDAPTIARLQPREEPLRLRRGKVVPDRRRELEEFRRHDRADRVEARVTTLGAAMAVSEEAGQRIKRARLQLTAEDVHS